MNSPRPPRSLNWRVTSSSIKAVEGAYILRSLRKVAGAAGLPARHRVRFNTTATTSPDDPQSDDVKIDAGDVFTSAPIPPANLDILVGRTLHEVEHYSINSSGVWSSCYYKVPEPERNIFQAFVHIGEDIVIDHRLTANQNLKDYYEAALAKVFEGTGRLNLANLLEVWITYSLARRHEVLWQVPEILAPAMQELVFLTQRLREPADRLTGTRLRAEYYLTTWEAIKEVLLHPPELTTTDCGDGGTTPQDSASGDEMRPPSRTVPGPTDRHNPKPRQNNDALPLMNYTPAPIDQRLAQAIEEAMASDTEDITRQVYREFEEAGYTSRALAFVVTRKHETRTIPVRPDPEQCRRLERVLTIRKRLQARVMRGENFGKLDMRKLHRSQTDQRMFKLKYRFPDGFPDTAILVDMSGSMSGKQAEEVVTAAASLAAVVKCKVWSYAENSSEIKLVKLDDGKMIHGCTPGGNTPSGIALVGVADTMKKGGLIIHLTDGEHNVEFGPAEATQVLERKGIGAVHLLWGKQEGPYKGLPCKLLAGGLSEFPDALYWILVQQLKLEALATGRSPSVSINTPPQLP